MAKIAPEILEKLCQLFSQGVSAQDPRVAALVPRPGTRNMLHGAWKGWGKPEHYHPREKNAVPVGGHVTEAVLPGGERVGGIDEVKHPATPLKPEAPPKLEAKEEKESEEELEEEPEGEEKTEAEKPEAEKAKPRIELATKEDIENTIPEKVVGEGLPIRVAVSIKTLALYQYMRAKSGDSLELGDFIDDCVADVFKGRGFDLGLVKLEGGKSG